MAHSTQYTFVFAGAVCLVCAIVVSTAAVTLAPRQEANARLDRQLNVLEADGQRAPGEELDAAEAAERFATIVPVVVDLRTGRERPDLDPASPPAEELRAPDDTPGLSSLPRYVVVYKHLDAGKLSRIILPVEGQGMWSRLQGFLALGGDLNTVETLTFHTQKETPGLGGEIDNPRWKAGWKGRRAFDEAGQVHIEVIKGAAGPAAEDPFRVDGITGATITSRSVSALVRFWLGPEGFGPYLRGLQEGDG